MGRLREAIWYFPGEAAGAGTAALPLLCRSVIRFSGEPGDASAFTAKTYWHLHWVASGSLRMTTGDGERRIPAGHAVMVPPGRERRFVAASPVAGHGLSVIGPQAEPIIRALGGDPPVLRPGPPPAGAFARLEQEVRLITDGGVRAASATTYRILTEAYRETAQGPDADEDRIVDRAIQLIDAWFHDPAVHVNWLAEQVGCHRSHLAHRFRARTGLSPSEYLIRRRLQRAMHALHGSAEPVGRVARSCGFASLEYFSRVFRKRVGASPTAFRAEA